MKSVVDMMYGLIKQGNQTLISKNKADIQDIKPFINGRTLFMENLTLVLPSMRDADVDFGIIPLPKYNEEQEHYYSMASTTNDDASRYARRFDLHRSPA